MLSFIYMKILESQPSRYDRAINVISFGAARRLIAELVDQNVRPGDTVLDIGCGTGTAAILAARKGATVVGVDVSHGMLAIAGRKIESEGCADRIELLEMGISGIDSIREDGFDVVISTLVFSELSSDEQDYALHHARRVLKHDGRLAIVDEVRPNRMVPRVLYALFRLPLLCITFLLTQTTTRPVEGLAERVAAAGFKIDHMERRGLGTILYLTAAVGEDP